MSRKKDNNYETVTHRNGIFIGFNQNNLYVYDVNVL